MDRRIPEITHSTVQSPLSANRNIRHDLTNTLSDFTMSFRAEIPVNPTSNPVSHRYNDIPGQINKESINQYFNNVFSPS